MANKKKYQNNVDLNTRHHYDVYEIIGDHAYHIAPFTQELDAKRVADALAALAYAENSDLIVDESRYIVRARPTVAHKIYDINPKELNKQIEGFRAFRKRIFSTLDEQDEKPNQEAPKIKKTAKKKASV